MGEKKGGRDRQTEGIVLVMTQGKPETGKNFLLEIYGNFSLP